MRRSSSANFFSAAQALAALALDFKKHPPDTPVPQQNALQRRDADPAIAVGILLFKPGELRTEVKTPQLFERITDNQALAVARAPERIVVMRHQNAVGRQPDIHFEHVDAQRHGSVESDHRVFGKQVLASAVSDDKGSRPFRTQEGIPGHTGSRAAQQRGQNQQNALHPDLRIAGEGGFRPPSPAYGPAGYLKVIFLGCVISIGEMPFTWTATRPKM